MKPSIVFMGTPQIAADVLEALVQAGYNITLAVTQPDRPVGRKGRLTPCAVKEKALEYGIELFQPERIRTDYQKLLDVHPDLIVTCAYGQIVPQAVLDAPVHGCVNLHGSRLPAYRGAAPIQRAVMDGLTQSAMALMKMEAGLDTGPVAAIEPVAIEPGDTSSDVFEKMGQAAGKLICRHIDALLDDSIEFIPQDDAKATYAAKISKAEEHLDLSQKDETLYNAMRGLARDPGGFVLVDGKKLKLLSVRYRKGAATPGKGVFGKEGKKQLIMGGDEGIFYLDEVQLEGKSAMKSADFVNGAGRSFPGKKGE